MKIKFLFKKVNFVKTIFFTVFISLFTVQYSRTVTKGDEHVIEIDVRFEHLSILATLNMIFNAIGGFNYFLLKNMADTVIFVGADFVIKGLNEFNIPPIEICCLLSSTNKVCYRMGSLTGEIGLFDYLYPKVANIILNLLPELEMDSELKDKCENLCLNDQSNCDNLLNNMCFDFSKIMSKYPETKKIKCIINCLNKRLEIYENKIFI